MTPPRHRHQTNEHDPLQFPRTETGDAERVAARFPDRIRYAEGLGYRIWDGRRWAPDPERHRTMRHVLHATRELFDLASDLQDSEQRQAWVKHALAGERRSRQANIVALLPTLPSIRIDADEFDTNPDLLNLLVGTLILPEARIKPHDPADRITKLAGATTYDSSRHRATLGTLPTRNLRRRRKPHRVQAESPRLLPLRPHQRRMPLHPLRHRRQRQEHRTTHHQRPRRRIRRHRPSRQLRRQTQRRHPKRHRRPPRRPIRHQPAKAKADARLAEGLVKQLTGRDPVTARFLYQEPFTFTPAFKIWLATNHKPIIRGTDEGIWRRIKLIPYRVTIPPERRDPAPRPSTTPTKLPGILNWLITGYLMWRQEGLGTTPAIEHATTNTAAKATPSTTSSPPAATPPTPHATTSSRDLHTEYRRWCEANGEEPLSANLFGRLLTDRGHPTSTQRINGRATKVRAGLSLQIGNTVTQNEAIGNTQKVRARGGNSRPQAALLPNRHLPPATT